MQSSQLALTAAVILITAASALADPTIIAFGLPHEPLGDAELTFTDDTLTVAGIGAAGTDGVAIAPGDAAGWSAAVDFGLAGALASNSRLDLVASFDVDGGPAVAHLAFVETARGLTSVQVPTLTTDGPTTVELRLDGVTVDSIVLGPPPFGEIARGAIGSVGDAAPSVRVDRTAADGVLARTLVVTTPEPTMITLAGSTPVLADEIRVRTKASPRGPIADAAVALTASGLDAFTLRREGLVQFGLDLRPSGDLTLVGELDEASGPTVRITEVSALNDASIEITPIDAEDDSTTAEIRATVENPGGGPPFLAWQRIVSGHGANGETAEIAHGTFFMGACGCSFSFLADDPALDNDPVKTVIARLNGAAVATVIDKPGFNMWSTGAVQLPEEWTFELDPTAPPGQFAYRERCRWDAPTTIYIQETGTIEVDEVEVHVLAAAPSPDEAPISIDGMTVWHTGFFDPTVDFIYTDLGFGAADCAPDLDGDGAVDAADLATLLGAWGVCAACQADLDGDGTVGAADLAMLLGAWGGCEAG